MMHSSQLSKQNIDIDKLLHAGSVYLDGDVKGCFNDANTSILKEKVINYYKESQNLKINQYSSLLSQNINDAKTSKLNGQIEQEQFTIDKLESCGKPFGNSSRKSRCKQAVCPSCAKLVYFKHYKKVNKIDKHCSELAFTQLITIHTEDVEVTQLKNSYSILAKACSALFNSRQYKKLTQGAMRAFEVSVADTGLYHPHMHLLVVYKEDIDIENATQSMFDILQAQLNNSSIYLSPAEAGLNSKMFMNYISKTPDMTAEEWLTYRKNFKHKQKITFSGICNLATKKQRKTK